MTHTNLTWLGWVIALHIKGNDISFSCDVSSMTKGWQIIEQSVFVSSFCVQWAVANLSGVTATKATLSRRIGHMLDKMKKHKHTQRCHTWVLFLWGLSNVATTRYLKRITFLRNRGFFPASRCFIAWLQVDSLFRNRWGMCRYCRKDSFFPR